MVNAQMTIQEKRNTEYMHFEPGEHFFLGIVLAVILYLLDVGSDCYLAYSYKANNQLSEFWWTLAFILLPGIMMLIFNCFEYVNYIKFTNQKGGDQYPTTPHWRWVLRVVCMLIIPLNPLPRYMEMWENGVLYLKGKEEHSDLKKKQYFVLLSVEQRSAGVLRLIESFMECAPQLLLQLHILGKADGILVGDSSPDLKLLFWTFFSITTSVLSLTWALTTWRPLVIELEAWDPSLNVPNNKPTWYHVSVLYLAHLLWIISRVVVLFGMFASLWNVWIPTILLLGLHFVVMMTLWLLQSNRELEHYQVEWNWKQDKRRLPTFRYLGLILLATVISTFGYLHNNARLRHAIYGAVCVLQNAGILFIIWFNRIEILVTFPMIFTIHAVCFVSSITLFSIFYYFQEKLLNTATWASEVAKRKVGSS